MFNLVKTLHQAIQSSKPLVLNLTNEVSINFVANGLLALGASPIMSNAPQEMTELLAIASALVINPGTLSDEFISLAFHAGSIASTLQKPIILDPVGAGASQYRTSMHQRFLQENRVTIVRGNASEIMALAGISANTKGVDSTAEGNQALDAAKSLNHKYNAVIVVSGAIDYVVHQEQVVSIQRGSPLMPLLTGTGCLLSAVVGAFSAVTDNPMNAAVAATQFYAVAGELATEYTKLPGSFMVHFMDALHMNPKQRNYDNSAQQATTTA